jgi:hypothetical protein
MTYIDLNMVRAGVVRHPREWKWCGYDELIGTRKRYTVLSMDKVVELVGGGDREQFARDYAAALEDAIDRGDLRREPYWSESIAVGSKDYVSGIADQIKGRAKIKVKETDGGAWSVHEPVVPYGHDANEDEGVPYGQIPGTQIERKRGVWLLKWA